MENLKVIPRIKEVKVSILKPNPPILQIEALGEVNSGGWTQGTLLPYVYIVPPKDGIYEFDFVALAPTGPATRALEDIEASYDWRDFPKDLKGVRVHGAENSKETLIK